MIFESASHHRNTLNLALEDFAERSGLGILFIHRVEILDDEYKKITRKNFCPFCSFMTNHPALNNYCYSDHKSRGLRPDLTGKLQICHAGLFNISVPIRVYGKLVASILIGQRKIIEQEIDSQRGFQRFIQSVALSKEKKLELENLFRQVESVSKKHITDRATCLGKSTRKMIEHLLLVEAHNRERITSIVHELLLPMQALTIEAENLKEETYDEKMDINFLREAGSHILFELNNLNVLGHNLRKIMELPVIGLEYELKLISILPLIEKARRMFEWEAKEKEVVIKRPSYTGGAFPKLMLAEDEIQIALSNLYSNAVKYSFASGAPYTGQRYITTECDDEIIEGEKYFSVEISNFGIGILQEEIETGRMYDQGYRGILSRDRNRTGSGVGLYLIKEIVERVHKGKMKITSEDKQSAYLTTIKIMLPYFRKG